MKTINEKAQIQREDVWVVAYEINRKREHGYDSDWVCWWGDDAESEARELGRQWLLGWMDESFLQKNEVVVTIMQCPNYPVPMNDSDEKSDEYWEAMDAWWPWDCATTTEIVFTNEVAA